MRRVLLAAVVLVAATARADGPILKNGDFAAWDGDAPQGWARVVGAQRDGGTTPRLERLDGGGVRLAGDAETRTWWLLAQEAAMPSSPGFRLRFEARLVDARLDPGQRENAYVRATWPTPNGERAGTLFTAFRPTWTPEEQVFAEVIPSAKVEIFLSKTGSLEVRRVGLEPLRPADAFDVLVAHMDRYYSFFVLKKVDWAALTARYRDRALAAKDEPAFVAVLKEMLGELKDVHVWINTSGGKQEQTWRAQGTANYDYRALAKSLRNVRQISKSALVGEIGEDVGFLAIGSLVLTPEVVEQIDAALTDLLDKRGLILDLRANTGGDETHAQRFGAKLADQRRVYARRVLRVGAAHDAMSEPHDVWVVPAEGKRFQGKIVCLLGPHCVSSGEGFAQLMDVLPNVRTVGQPTCGASGAPAPVTLPNGVTVSFSRWIDYQADGTILEGRGVQPDVVVAHEGPGDPTFDAGLKELRAMLR